VLDFLNSVYEIWYKFVFIKIVAIFVLFTWVPIMKSTSKLESVANEI
jgi:HAMP domain-containing protein